MVIGFKWIEVVLLKSHLGTCRGYHLWASADRFKWAEVGVITVSLGHIPPAGKR